MLLGDWLEAKPFTLTMSSGFFAFFAHLGMLEALQANGLSPRRVTGSSAGALVGACWAAGVPVGAMKSLLGDLKREAFWDPAPGLGLLRGHRFQEMLASLTGDPDMENLPVPAAVSVWHAGDRNTRVIRRGSLVKAVAASCAVPVLFHPVRLEGAFCWDGGIRDRHGLAGCGADERVFYHHIASRSPWRRTSSPALAIPQREALAALSIDQLPRSGPSKLDAGRRALVLARQATEQALDRPLQAGAVTVIADQDAAS